MKTPRLEVGEIYHISHKKGVPADIYIEMVYMKPKSTEWMYAIRSEANNCDIVYVPESLLINRMSKRSSPVYKNEFVIDLLNSGYRFAGNVSDIDSARTRGEEFAKNPNIHDVMLYNALNSDGKEIDGYGIWIRWNTVIGSKHNKGNAPIRIK